MCSRELVRSCILSYHLNKTSHMQLSFYTHLGSPLSSWWFEISSLIAQECHTDYQLHLNTVFVQVHFVPSVLGFHRVWKACDVLLYCAGPTYSSSACLCAATWCTLLFLRPTPNILVSKCETVVVCIFLYFFCTSWRIAENISFAVFNTVIRLILWVTRCKMLICMETDGRHTHCLPITFTVHGDRLLIPFCCSLPERKHFEDTMSLWHFTLLFLIIFLFWCYNNPWACLLL